MTRQSVLMPGGLAETVQAEVDYMVNPDLECFTPAEVVALNRALVSGLTVISIFNWLSGAARGRTVDRSALCILAFTCHHLATEEVRLNG